MQSLVLSPSFVTLEFGRLQFHGPERHLYSQPRSANARRGTPRDLPLPCSMSSSVPAEDLLETLGNVRRPGHSDLPKPATTAAITSAGTAMASSAAPGPILSPESPNPLSTRQPALVQRIVTAPGDEALRQPFTFGEQFPSSRFPPTFTGHIPAQSPTVTHHQPTFGAATVGQATRALPQKTTRRTKAHVASACVNCKKKHLGCDPARPCRRCVLSGKADTCVDVTHKKRGRPPLKADEGSLRYATQLDPRGAPGDPGNQARRPMHRATSSRELRPMPDLQQFYGTQRGMMGGRLPPGQPQPWSTAVYPQSIDPSLTTQRTMSHRRFSSSESAQSMTAVSPPGYGAVPPGYNPGIAAGRMPPGVGRPMPIYPNQGMHPTPSPPQYNQSYGLPISPYTESGRVAGRISMSEGSVQRDPREAYIESPVRLPPIYPSPVTNPEPPRPTEPYPATWSPSQQQMQHARPHQGAMEPISPVNLARPPPAEVGQLGLLGLLSSPEDSSRQLPPARTYDDREHDADEGDSSRPAKRRKMALDDIVNN
ncbi:hypothetical protein BDW69DRAFT_191711 [Aspergillus filifer]